MEKRKKKKNKIHQYLSDLIKYIRKSIKEWFKNTNEKFENKIEKTSYVLDFYKNYFITKLKRKRGFLLIPPTELDGSFGDELMVVSFVNNFKNESITLYEPKIIVREDLFKDYKNVSYLKWGESLKNKSFLTTF